MQAVFPPRYKINNKPKRNELRFCLSSFYQRESVIVEGNFEAGYLFQLLPFAHEKTCHFGHTRISDDLKFKHTSGAKHILIDSLPLTALIKV